MYVTVDAHNNHRYTIRGEKLSLSVEGDVTLVKGYSTGVEKVVGIFYKPYYVELFERE